MDYLACSSVECIACGVGCFTVGLVVLAREVSLYDSHYHDVIITMVKMIMLIIILIMTMQTCLFDLTQNLNECEKNS